MTSPGLPTNIDATYADSGTDASVKLHQQYHDSIHGVVNQFTTAAPSATGMVPRWNGSVYAPSATNVTYAYDYGMRGAGADETTVIQAALNATPAGGTCQLTNGTSLISSTLVIPNYVSVRGVGSAQPFVAGSGTTLQAASGFNGDIMKNVNIDLTDFWMHGTRIEGIQFRAASGQTGGSGLRVGMGETSIVRDCSFVLFPDAGIRMCHFLQPSGVTVSAIADAVTTTITLSSATGTPASGQYLARIEDETVLVTAGQGTTTLTVTRGYQGTTAKAHGSVGFFVQKGMFQAPAWFENINVYGNKYGLWCDYAAGNLTVFGLTGDNNSSHVAITYPDNNANNGGRFLTVTLIGMKIESSTWNGGATATSEDPIVLMNNPNGAQVNILGGTATSATGDSGVKNVCKMTNGYNGVSSTVDGALTIYGFSPNNYLNLLSNTISGETYPWYTGDDYPEFKNLAMFNYGGEVRMRSDAARPRTSWSVTAPSYPMVRRSLNPKIGSVQTVGGITSAATSVTIDSTLAAALPASGNYIMYIESEPVKVTAGQGTATLTISRAYDPGGGATPLAHAQNAPVYYYSETWDISGTTTPVGNVSAPPGSTYTRTDASPGFWIKASGYDATGWQRQGNVGASLVTAAAGSNAGTTPPAPIVTGATDKRGKVTWGTGTTAAAGNQVVVTFGTAYAAAPAAIVFTAGNSATAALNPYVTSIGTTSFTIATQGAPASSQANTVYAGNYVVSE